jgi:esterase/lipase superfamily enzyme
MQTIWRRCVIHSGNSSCCKSISRAKSLTVAHQCNEKTSRNFMPSTGCSHQHGRLSSSAAGRFGSLLLALALTTACAPRADLVPDPIAADASNSVPVYVGTTRQPTTDGLWSDTSPAPLSYGVAYVSVPPDRRPGEVTIPRGNPDARTDFLTQRVARFPDRAAFRTTVAKDIQERMRSGGDVVVTIHGFNTRMADGIFRTAQMVEDYGMQGPTFHYAWPSRGAPLAYVTDRDSVLLARNGLEQMLDDLSRAGASRIVLVAHSMGSQLTMEVLRQMALRESATLDRIGAVVLMSPDIDPSVFASQARDIGTLPQPFVVFTSKRDPALRLSARLTGHGERLGNLTSLDPLQGQEIIVIDLSEARDAASRHLAAATSPTIIEFLRQTEAVRVGIQTDSSGRPGLIPGTVLLAQEATSVLLAPAEILSQ